MQDHPAHKFPLDAWASSLGEGTQDVQKLIIFREIMKKECGSVDWRQAKLANLAKPAQQTWGMGHEV
jgi:hypothetical protein